MKILITGASGFLGQALCRFLEAQKHELTKLNSRNCDLTHPESLNQFNAEKFAQIYHLAAWTQAGDFCLYHPGEQWIINQQINTNTLAWWQKEQPQAKLIAIGPSCAYEPGTPHKEENFLIGTPTESLFTYAMIKRMLYIGLLVLNKQFGLKYLMVVPSTLYGPGYHTDGRQMHFIFDLIRKILRGKLYNEPVVLWGDGYQKRELIHVDDFVRIMVYLADNVDNDIFNIGGGEEHAIRDFAKMICDKVGYDPDLIQYDTSQYVGAREKFLIIDKVKKAAPDFKLKPLSEGLSETIDWFYKEKDRLLSR